MKINRYIYVPFIMGALNAFINYLILRTDLTVITVHFISFALFGFGLLLYNDYRVGKLTSKDNKKAFEVRQQRNVILFTNYEKAFDLCLESISVLRKANIKVKDKPQGIIKVRAKTNWHTFGNKITFKLIELTEITTEIEISTEPIPRTVLVDNGEGFKTVEEINKFFEKANEEINRKYIEAKQFIPTEFSFNYKNNKVRVD